MNAKAFLRNVEKLDKLIANKMVEIQQWKDVAENTTANMTGDRVQSSHNPHKIADAIGRYVDLEMELRADIENLIASKKDVIAVIEQLEATEYDILHKIYIQHLSLWDVADACERTYSWVTTIHGQAVKHVQQILNKRG
jgi:DNA-directed RNA polymerase specialized sigma subunit